MAIGGTDDQQRLRLDRVMLEERMTAPNPDLSFHKAELFFCKSYVLVASR